MTFLEELQAHRGGLLRLKGELFWYGGRGWDGSPGQVCLLLDAADVVVAAATTRLVCDAPAAPDVLLLIDGAPHWVWVCQEDVELIT